MNALYCWYQLGDKTELHELFADTIQSDERFVEAMSALSGWANSSSVGIYHPLYRHVVEYFTSADEAKARLERLTTASATNPVLRDKAKELLGEWDDKVFS